MAILGAIRRYTASLLLKEGILSTRFQVSCSQITTGTWIFDSEEVLSGAV